MINEACQKIGSEQGKSLNWSKLTAIAIFFNLEDTEEEMSMRDDSLLGYISTMKTDTTFADVILVCEGVNIPCHRNILAALSGRFENLVKIEGFVYV